MRSICADAQCLETHKSNLAPKRLQTLGDPTKAPFQCHVAPTADQVRLVAFCLLQLLDRINVTLDMNIPLQPMKAVQNTCGQCA